MTGWLIALVLGLLLILAGYGWWGANEDARIAGVRVDSIASLNVQLRTRQKADSAALEQTRLVYGQRLTALEAERRGARQEAATASRTAQNAQTVLRHTLAGQDSALALLDALVEAEEQEDRAQSAELAAADSTTAVVQSLLEATERALASERILRRGGEAENLALRMQVDALNRGRRFERFAGVGTVVVLVGVSLVIW